MRFCEVIFKKNKKKSSKHKNGYNIWQIININNTKNGECKIVTEEDRLIDRNLNQTPSHFDQTCFTFFSPLI